MSDAIIIALIGAGASIAAAGLSLWNVKQSSAIHVLVNSNLTAVKSDLAEARVEIVNLQNMLRKEP